MCFSVSDLGDKWQPILHVREAIGRGGDWGALDKKYPMYRTMGSRSSALTERCHWGFGESV